MIDRTLTTPINFARAKHSKQTEELAQDGRIMLIHSDILNW